MNILDIKKILKEKKITYAMLSDKAGIPIQTIQKIFSGNTPNPRVDTMAKIEKALDLHNEKNPCDDEEFLQLYSSLSDLQKDKVKAYIQGLLS